MISGVGAEELLHIGCAACLEIVLQPKLQWKAVHVLAHYLAAQTICSMILHRHELLPIPEDIRLTQGCGVHCGGGCHCFCCRQN
jgi:hypothetical protein